MDRFENMQSFARVVESGSISAAAERMGIAKSVVSRRLKELEEHLGVELFHRTTRRMKLTDTGNAYYQRCQRILDDILEAELATSQAHGSLKGGMKMALPLSFGMMHLGPAISDFLKLHPLIEFDLDFNDREVDLIQEGFDLAIRIATLADSSLLARRIAPISSVLCASPAYLERFGQPESPEQLVDHRCLVYSLIRNFEQWQFIDNTGKMITSKIRPYLKASNGEFLKYAAVMGQGITLTPTFIAYQEIESGELLPLLTDYTLPAISAYALYPPTRHLSQRVRAFIDFLLQRYSETPYWDNCLQGKRKE